MVGRLRELRVKVGWTRCVTEAAEVMSVGTARAVTVGAGVSILSHAH